MSATTDNKLPPLPFPGGLSNPDNLKLPPITAHPVGPVAPTLLPGDGTPRTETGPKAPYQLDTYDATPAVQEEFEEWFHDKLPAADFIKTFHQQHPEAAKEDDDALSAVNMYTGFAFQSVNHALRTGNINGADAVLIKEIADGLNDFPVHAGTVYRGMSAPQAQMDKYKVRETVVDPAFVSTSASADITNDFINSGSPSSAHALVVINSRHGRDVDSISANQGEQEVLFEPGTRFKVLAKEYDPDSQLYVIFLDET